MHAYDQEASASSSLQGRRKFYVLAYNLSVRAGPSQDMCLEEVRACYPCCAPVKRTPSEDFQDERMCSDQVSAYCRGTAFLGPPGLAELTLIKSIFIHLLAPKKGCLIPGVDILEVRSGGLHMS